jgi:hypothetical protein
MATDLAAWLQALAGFATFGAACVAVKASYDAPRRAAEFAENLRQETQKSERDRNLQMLVFTNLMQFRAQILNPTAVASLNVIEVAFREHKEVREAWRHFLEAASEQPAVAAKIVERYLSIIEKMARALGLSSDLSVKDIQNVYYPQSLGEADEAATLETQARLRRLRKAPLVAKPRQI